MEMSSRRVNARKVLSISDRFVAVVPHAHSNDQTLARPDAASSHEQARENEAGQRIQTHVRVRMQTWRYKQKVRALLGRVLADPCQQKTGDRVLRHVRAMPDKPCRRVSKQESPIFCCAGFTETLLASVSVPHRR